MNSGEILRNSQGDQGGRSRNNKNDLEFKVAIQITVILARATKHCIHRHGDCSKQKLGCACSKRRQSHLTILSVDKDNRQYGFRV